METKETTTQPTGNLNAETDPVLTSVEKLRKEISNPTGELFAPTVHEAWWKFAIEQTQALVTISVTVRVYLPPLRGGFGRNNITIVRQRFEHDSPLFFYYVTYSAPETEPDTWIEYSVSFVDTVDPGSFNEEFQIEIYLQDKDPKTSRGTVTTVLPSSMP